MHRGGIAQFKPDQVLIHQDGGGKVGVEYVALVVDDLQAAPEPPSRRTLTREDVHHGDVVGVEGRDLIEHIGTIAHMNPKIAIVACTRGEWRLPYSLLHRIVEV